MLPDKMSRHEIWNWSWFFSYQSSPQPKLLYSMHQNTQRYVLINLKRQLWSLLQSSRPCPTMRFCPTIILLSLIYQKVKVTPIFIFWGKLNQFKVDHNGERFEVATCWISEEICWEKSFDGKAFTNSEKSGHNWKEKKWSFVWCCFQVLILLNAGCCIIQLLLKLTLRWIL